MRIKDPHIVVLAETPDSVPDFYIHADLQGNFSLGETLRGSMVMTRANALRWVDAFEGIPDKIVTPEQIEEFRAFMHVIRFPR